MLLNLDYQRVEISEGVTIEVKALDVKDYHSLTKFTMKIMECQSEDDKPEIAGLKQLSNDDLMAVGSEMIPKYCQNLEGVEITESGSTRQAKVEDLIKYGAFSPLIIVVLTKLFEVSTIKNDDQLKK